MEIRTFSSVWDAVADSPEEADNLKLRSQIMDAIEEYIPAGGHHAKGRGRTAGRTSLTDQ